MDVPAKKVAPGDSWTHVECNGHLYERKYAQVKGCMVNFLVPAPTSEALATSFSVEISICTFFDLRGVEVGSD